MVKGAALPRPRRLKVAADPADVQAVLAAYDAAQAAGKKTVDCYIEAREAWRKRHRDHTEEYAAMKAVEIALDNRTTLRPEG